MTTLQEAIDEVRKTLTQFLLGWRYVGAELTEEEKTARIVVSDFPHLESIEIDLPFLRKDSIGSREPPPTTDLAQVSETLLHIHAIARR